MNRRSVFSALAGLAGALTFGLVRPAVVVERPDNLEILIAAAELRKKLDEVRAYRLKCLQADG